MLRRRKPRRRHIARRAPPSLQPVALPLKWIGRQRHRVRTQRPEECAPLHRLPMRVQAAKRRQDRGCLVLLLGQRSPTPPPPPRALALLPTSLPAPAPIEPPADQAPKTSRSRLAPAFEPLDKTAPSGARAEPSIRLS